MLCVPIWLIFVVSIERIVKKTAVGMEIVWWMGHASAGTSLKGVIAGILMGVSHQSSLYVNYWKAVLVVIDRY